MLRIAFCCGVHAFAELAHTIAFLHGFEQISARPAVNNIPQPNSCRRKHVHSSLLIHRSLHRCAFAGVGAFVKAAFEDSLNGILNKRTTDVLLDIQKAKARGRPYVIVFCGVNGVGKSTNLAKIAYWLLQHNVRPMVAACDTFRAGAVEQLKTHCARLKVGTAGGRRIAYIACRCILAVTLARQQALLTQSRGT